MTVDKNTIVLPTPGPWECTDSGLIYGQAQDDEGEAPLVCDVCVDPGLMTAEEEANACLIAAAPDMLEALKTVAEDCRMALSGEWDKSDEGFEATLEAVEKVIAKAKGGAQ